MKQVWILNHYALEPSSAGGTRHFSLAAHLRAHGWHATVIAASVEHNSNRQRLDDGERLRHQVHESVPFLWLRTPQYEGNGGGRMLNMLVYTLRALFPSSTRGLPKPDAVIGSSVHPFAAMAGAQLARRHGVPFVFEVRDLWPQTLVDLGRLREHSFMAWALRRLERRLYRAADRIVTLLPHATDYITPLGIPREKVVWIPNGVDLSSFPATSPVQRGTEPPFVLMYFGAHGTANGLDDVLHAMRLVSRRVPQGAIKLRLIGDGPLKSALATLAQQLGLDNVTFEAPVPKNAIPALAGQADAFVISILDRPKLYRYGISMNKLFDYLAAARPIVIASAAVNNPVEEAGAGITVRPGDPEALCEAILALMHLPPEERQRMGSAGRRYVELNHGFDRLAEHLAATLNACMNEAGPVARPLAKKLRESTE